MFSFFRKKPKQPELPKTPEEKYRAEYLANPAKFKQDAANLRKMYGNNFRNKTNAEILDALVELLVMSNEAKKMNAEYEEAERKKEAKRHAEEAWIEEAVRQSVEEEAAEQAAENERMAKKERNRQQRLNNLTRKYSYKTKQNLINNAGRQRGPWRAEHPSAPYMSIENFANSPYFQPHSLFTGISNNASTISYNSPRSVRSNRPYSPFGGKRRKTRRLKH